MTTTEIVHAISEHVFPLSDKCKLAFSKGTKILAMEKDEVFVREGQYSKKAFFIIKGSTRSYYFKDGRDITDWFAFEGNFICPINSFYLDIPSPYTFQAMENTLMLEIPKSLIDQLANEYPEFEKLVSTVITKTMLQLHKRLVSMQFQSAEQKYLDILDQHPQIEQRVALTHIASHIGITLETLSRIRSRKA